MDRPLSPLEKLAAASLEPADFRDIWLYAFSRRENKAGKTKITRPRPIAALRAAVEENPALKYCIHQKPGLLPSSTSESLKQETQCDDYDYESDSDLDDEDIDNSEDNASSEKAPTSQDSPTAQIKQVMVPNVAFRTLRAAIYYLYVGKCATLPLKSQDGGNARIDALKTSSASYPPPCSPKSLYRVAIKLELPELQRHALAQFAERLTLDVVVHEAFSRLASRYDDLRAKATSFIGNNYDHPKIQQAIRAKDLLGLAVSTVPLSDLAILRQSLQITTETFAPKCNKRLQPIRPAPVREHSASTPTRPASASSAGMPGSSKTCAEDEVAQKSTPVIGGEELGKVV